MIGVFLAPVTIDRAGDQIIYFTSLSTTGPPAWVVLPLIFVLVATVPGRPGRGGRPVLRRTCVRSPPTAGIWSGR